ncbi:MAG: type II CAAX endopeptidase family protein [Methanomassiliicoccus sp.]|nr:type II CAAX endopeptidase family protein [Methanomassiliicoccus sp.]
MTASTQIDPAADVHRGDFIKRHKIALFFAVTYAISWSAMTILALGLAGELSVPAFLIAQFGPAIAGVIMVWASGGSLREFASRLVKWRVPVKWYFIVITLPIALTLGSSVWLIMFNFPVNYSLVLEKLPAYIPSLIFTTLIAGLGEEPGWRGFALPNLQERLSPVKATVILGVLWATWHFPLLFIDQEFMGLPLGGTIMLVAVVLLTLLMIASLAFFYTWIYNHTGSILLMMLLHGSITVAQGIFLPLTGEASHASDYPLLLLSITGTIVITAIILVYATKGRLGYGPEA